MTSITIANKTDFPLDVSFIDKSLFSFVVKPLSFRAIIWNKGIIKLSFTCNGDENIIEKHIKHNTVIEFDGNYKILTLCGVENCKNKVCVLNHHADIDYKMCISCGNDILSNNYKTFMSSTMSSKNTTNVSLKNTINILLYYMQVDDLVRYATDMGINLGGITVKSSIIAKILGSMTQVEV